MAEGRRGLGRRLGRLAILGGLAVAAAMAPAAAPTTGAAAEVTIFAAASTTDAVQAAIARYAAASGRQVRPVFAASSTLAKQIAAGAPADIYLSANAEWMDWLENRGGVAAGSRRDLLGNTLVVVVPQQAPPLSGPGALPAYLGERRLALGDPSHVPAGRYAKAALESLGLWTQLRGRSAFGSDVRAALALVARGEAAAGIVYATDAPVSDAVRVAAELPADSHPPIRYPLARVVGADTPAVTAFFEFLQGPEAARAFRRHGFRVLTGAAGS